MKDLRSLGVPHPAEITDELLVYKGGIFLPTKTAVTLSEQKRKQQKKMAVVKITGWGVEDDQPSAQKISAVFVR